jgi:hypothetical protein
MTEIEVSTPWLSSVDIRGAQHVRVFSRARVAGGYRHAKHSLLRLDWTSIRVLVPSPDLDGAH